MRVRHIVVLILLAVNRTAGATGEENELFVTIPVVDTSAAGSPVKSTGTVRFSEDAEKGRAVCSFECTINQHLTTANLAAGDQARGSLPQRPDRSPPYRV